MRRPHADQENHQAQTIFAATASDRPIRSQRNQAPAAQWVTRGQSSEVGSRNAEVGKGKVEVAMIRLPISAGGILINTVDRINN
jgi:hypothetical protein